PPLSYLFFFYSSHPPRHLHSFPTRRSSDLNEFLRSKEEKLKAGELSHRSFRDYYGTCQELIDHFGKERRVDDLRPDDFRKFRSRSEEHTSELQSRGHLVCRLLLEKKKTKRKAACPGPQSPRRTNRSQSPLCYLRRTPRSRGVSTCLPRA